MVRSNTTKWVLLVIGVVVAGVSANLLIGFGYAPAGGTLHIQAVAHERLADAGGKGEASVVVGLYTDASPVKGLLSGSFSVKAVVVPAGGFEIKKTNVTEVSSGVYRIDVVPTTDNPSAVWKKGRYVLSVTLTSAQGPAVAVTELLVDLDS